MSVIQPGGASNGATASTGTGGTAVAIPTLDNGNYPKWVHVALIMDNGKGVTFNFDSVHLDSTKALDGSVAPTAANPVVVKSAAHGYSDGDKVMIAGSTMTELNGRIFTVDNENGSDTFELEGENGLGRATGTGGTVAKNLFVADATATNGIGLSGYKGSLIINVSGCTHYKVYGSSTDCKYIVTPLSGIS